MRSADRRHQDARRAGGRRGKHRRRCLASRRSGFCIAWRRCFVWPTAQVAPW